MNNTLAPNAFGLQRPSAWPSSRQMCLALACGSAMFGVFGFYGTARFLLEVWRTDDLKSVGLLVPFLSFALILRAWRSIDWKMQGTWWGFAVLAGAALLVYGRDQTMLVLTVHRNWLVQLPPLPLLAVLYAAGTVLLFGGMRLLRVARFPVLLMGAVLPVPETFSRLVDLPLQHASATVARGFAHLLGQRLTPDNLRLMFTPEFGMFIAPGCNGIRGAVTLGLAATVLAYMYSFRWRLALPTVFGAVLLGYLFNLLRLCLLVVYYRIALPFPWLQDRAEGADYIIGGCLFVVALWGFLTIVDHVKQHPKQAVWKVPDVENHRSQPPVWQVAAKTLAMLGLALFFGMHDMHAEQKADVRLPLPAMPERLGSWQRVRTYQDTLPTGVVVYTWADYRKPGDNKVISVGVSPELNAHDVEICHIARGEDPVWHGQFAAQTVSGRAEFVGASYNNGLQQTLEASSLCENGSCREYTAAAGAMTFVYAHPGRVFAKLPAQGQRPVPLLLKVSSNDVGAPAPAIAGQLEAELQDFLYGADLQALTSLFRTPLPR